MSASQRTESATNGPAQSPRPYRSPLRDERAAQTRARIVDAARGLFAERGVAGATISLIARKAGVAQPTVYAAFGGKEGIMRELLGRLEVDADAAEWRTRIEAEPDPRRKLEHYAAWHAALFSRGRDVLAPALRAGDDPAVVEFRTEGDRSAAEWLKPIVDALDEAEALAPGLDRVSARHRAWMLTGPELYFRATDGCGWSDADYQRWLTGALQSQLLAPPATPDTGSTPAD